MLPELHFILGNLLSGSKRPTFSFLHDVLPKQEVQAHCWGKVIVPRNSFTSYARVTLRSGPTTRPTRSTKNYRASLTFHHLLNHTATPTHSQPEPQPQMKEGCVLGEHTQRHANSEHHFFSIEITRVTNG